MVYPLNFELKPPQLNLSALTAVQKKKPLMYVQYLGGWMSCCGRRCGTGAKNGNFKRKHNYFFIIIFLVKALFPCESE